MTYWLYRGLARLPLPVAYALAPTLAWLLRAVFRYRRRTVENNLRHSFPERDDAQRREILVRFYRQLVETTFEIIGAYRLPRAVLNARMRVRNPELIVALSEQRTRSVVILLIHQGNWEWMLHAVTDQTELPVDPVYKPLHDQGADRFMRELRSRFGAEPITAASAGRDVLRKRRKVRLLGLLADQSPGAKERKHWSPMLHQETAWHTGGATIARLTRSPVVFAQCRRLRRGHYEVTFHEITRDPRGMSEAAITDAYAAFAERAICDEPESYLWSNRRWKLGPQPQPQPVAPSDTAAGEAQSNQSKPSP